MKNQTRFILFIMIALINISLIALIFFDLTHYVPFFSALSGLGNIMLACVAFWQLPAMEHTNRTNQQITRANFLLKLTEKWMLPDLVNARCLLHKKALEIKKYGTTNITNITKEIGQYIIELSQNPEHERIKEFASIISLLEFLEILSCLYEDGHVEIETLNQLFGGSLDRYYHYFEDYIIHRRNHGSPAGVHFQSDEALYHRFQRLFQTKTSKNF